MEEGGSCQGSHNISTFRYRNVPLSLSYPHPTTYPVTEHHCENSQEYLNMPRVISILDIDTMHYPVMCLYIYI